VSGKEMTYQAIGALVALVPAMALAVGVTWLLDLDGVAAFLVGVVFGVAAAGLGQGAASTVYDRRHGRW